MDIPKKHGKGKRPINGKGRRKKTGPYGNAGQVPDGGRARERLLQDREARGLEDPAKAMGEFRESAKPGGNADNRASKQGTGHNSDDGKKAQPKTSSESKDEEKRNLKK